MGELRYLAFCGNCGQPREIHKYSIQAYWPYDCVGFYCLQCETANRIPLYLKKLTKELTEYEITDKRG